MHPTKVEDTKYWIIRFGDWLHYITWRLVYGLLYPPFSIIRASVKAIKESWNDAE